MHKSKFLYKDINKIVVYKLLCGNKRNEKIVDLLELQVKN